MNLRNLRNLWIRKELWVRRSASTLPFGLLVAGVAILGGGVLFRGRVLSGPDLLNYFLPTTLFARDWLRQGVLPLWDSMTFCGWPLVGDAQLRWLYPPNVLLLVMNPAMAFSLLMIGYVGFGATGMWFYLRKAAGVGPWPALCGAATLSLAGFFACHLMSGIVVFPATAAWVPWILLLGWRLGEKRVSAATMALFAGAIGAQILSGAPQVMFYTWIALSMQALWSVSEYFTRRAASAIGLRESSRRALAILARYAIGAALGIALGASSILPTSEFGALSLQRGGRARWEYVTNCSLAPRFLWLTVAPKFFGDPHLEETYWGGQEGYWDTCGYVGIGPLAALLVALFSWRSAFGEREPDLTGQTQQFQTATPRGFAAFHVALAGLALFLAFGAYNPFFRWVYEWIPGFDRFRVPSRWLLFYQFSVATLLALVIERFCGEGNGTAALPKRTLIAVGALATFLAAAALIAPEMMRAAGLREVAPNVNASGGRLLDVQLRNWTAGSLGRGAGFAFGWLILLGVAGKSVRLPVRRALPPLAAALVLADVLSFGVMMPVTRTRQGQIEEFYPKSPLIESLAAGSNGHRLLAADDVNAWFNDQNNPELWANRASIYGLRDARGYYPICLRWFGHFINALDDRPSSFPLGGLLSVGTTLNPWLLSMLDVKFFLSYKSLRVPGLRLTQRTSFGLNIYEVTGNRGPAFAARASTLLALSDEEELALLADGTSHMANSALSSGPAPEWLLTSPHEPPGPLRSVSVARPTPNRIEIAVGRGTGDLVVVSEAYHPGWTARVDGRPSRVVRANHALLGVYVPPGEHQVALAFQPQSFRIGLYLTLSALLALAAVGNATLGRRRQGAVQR